LEPAKVFVEQNDGLKILETEYLAEDYAIAIKKDNAELLKSINDALAELKEDGTIQSILDKYIVAK
ncbi:MAG: transporter substrate-binding domain-containing protein, partial [Clostridiales bacterium]